MIHTRLTGLLTVLLLGALFIAGCSSGGGEPTVSQGVHDVLQHEYDEALAELRAEREAKAREQAAREDAETLATRLTSELMTVGAEVDRLEGELETAKGKVTALETRIGAATDTADASAMASLHAQLNHATAEVTRLAGELTAANVKVAELDTLVGNATNPTADSLRGQVAKLTVDLAAAEARVTALTSQLGTAQSERDTAQQQVEQVRQQAQQQVQQAAQTLEANQRAQGLLDALGGLSAATSLTGFTAPPEAEVSVAARNALTFGPSTARKSSSTRSGFRYAKVTDTFGRTRTTVIYTDRELNRRLLDHYGSVRNDDDMTVFDLGAAPLALPSPILQTSETWSVTVSGLSRSLRGVDEDDDANTATTLPTGAEAARDPRSSYRGTLHGKGGSFVCRGEGCQVQATPDYEDAGGDNGQHALLSVAVAATGTGSSLHFKPDSNVGVQLYEGGPVGVDTEYLVFGYWVEDPASATGTYRMSPFAQVIQTADIQALPASGEARYTGAAAGVYVESPPFGSTDPDKRQGDFEAAVSLTAKFGSDSDDVVGGWISDFRTTPRGGSGAPRTTNWRVTLADVTTGTTVTASATIDGLGGSGSWAAQFVQARTNAASAEPPAIVGVFDTSGPSLHLAGAFGAKR